MNLTKRDFVKIGGLTTGASMVPVTAMAYGRNTPSPKNIIFLVSDGMSQGVVPLAEYFSRIQRGKQSNWWKWLKDPEVTQAMMETRSLNSAVTDSAAAASAWGSGSRVFNRAINTLPDGTQLEPIGNLAMAAGKKLGLVSTARITHATPAGFASSVPHRSMEDQIAEQYLKAGVDLIMGGGRYFFDPNGREDGKDLVKEYQKKGYTYLETAEQLAQLKNAKKILGLFDYDHLPYTIDQNRDPELSKRVPTLAEMTQAALDFLSRGKDGFFIQVEAARVDHAAHANDLGGVLWDQLAFDDAIAVADAFAANRDDTLVIVTTDHGNANPGLNGMGWNYEQSSRCLEAVVNYDRSLKGLHAFLKGEIARGRKPNEQTLKDLFMVHYQTPITGTDAKNLLANFSMQFPEDTSDQQKNFFGIAGQILGNKNGVGWTGISHTADLCPLMARGPGASEWKGFLENGHVFGKLVAQMGIRHTNPVMSYEKAIAYMTPHEPVRHSNWMDL